MDIDVTNIVLFDVNRALIRVALDQNRNAVFIRSLYAMRSLYGVIILNLRLVGIGGGGWGGN